MQPLADLPDNLKAEIRAWLAERREQYLTQQREEAERRMMGFMPTAGPDGDGLP